MNLTLQDSLEDYEAAVRRRVEKCFQNKTSKKVYIYGYGMMGKFVYQQLKGKYQIEGYIDSDTKKQNMQTEEQIRVYDLSDIKKESSIIIASLVGWSAIYQKCIRLGYFNCCHYEELAFFDHTLPHWNQAFENMAHSICRHWDKYLQIYHRLSDKVSKEVFENIIQFRLTLNIRYSESAHELSTKNGEQAYFDPGIVKTSDKEVFIDCGGYCGETTKQFIQFVSGKYHKIYIFEPDARLAKRTATDLRNENNITIYPYGVGKEESILYFNAVGDASGNFSMNGTERVRVVKISDLVKEKISYIKMDIEGMESEALHGVHEIIERDRPKLAISVYHKCDDIFAIAEQVLNYRKDYHLYLRHYSLNCDDTVMYFV